MSYFPSEMYSTIFPEISYYNINRRHKLLALKLNYISLPRFQLISSYFLNIRVCTFYPFPHLFALSNIILIQRPREGITCFLLPNSESAQENFENRVNRKILIKVLPTPIQASGVRRGGRGEDSPPPKSEKLLQKSGVIFQRSILSERSQKSKKYVVKIVKKVNFPYRF